MAEVGEQKANIERQDSDAKSERGCAYGYNYIEGGRQRAQCWRQKLVVKDKDRKQS